MNDLSSGWFIAGIILGIVVLAPLVASVQNDPSQAIDIGKDFGRELIDIIKEFASSINLSGSE